MLVLSRRHHESVLCFSHDHRIDVTVAEIRGDKVRLGFTAPPEVAIMREEIVNGFRGVLPMATQGLLSLIREVGFDSLEQLAREFADRKPSPQIYGADDVAHFIACMEGWKEAVADGDEEKEVRCLKSLTVLSLRLIVQPNNQQQRQGA
ncbi:carbon storage regulator [Planctomycetes bacterium Pan216]|uniref:Translational regulator CsrA n=1 Tax=Kolteria novifilia TaxID=2527975 RepID=A0A518B578_9BACT|nr:carbon storage regulator [Planctomycetes bacterium Pan216]